MEKFENAESSLDTETGKLEAALDYSYGFDEILDTLENNLTGSHIDEYHSYSKEEIIDAVKLARDQKTAEIALLYKVPGLQQAVADSLSEQLKT